MSRLPLLLLIVAAGCMDRTTGTVPVPSTTSTSTTTMAAKVEPPPAVVDERALVEALRHGWIAGAALDVFEEIDVFAISGKPATHPLLEMDNVILTPHSAGSSVESTLDSKLRGARNAAAVLSGWWPASVVNPGVRPRLPLAGG